MRLIIIESPYAGDLSRNLTYLRAAMRECLLEGDAPFASHALYTQVGVLDDDNEKERDLGIAAGLDWARAAERTVVYLDYGVSKGMEAGIFNSKTNKRPIEYRLLRNHFNACKHEEVVGELPENVVCTLCLRVVRWV